MKRLFAAFILILATALPALAAKRVALVIGNDDYAEVPKLQKAVNDARSVAQTMQKIGFDVDLGENLSRRQFNDKFARLLDRIEPGDTAFFFYAGHGVAMNGQNFLLPTDIPASDSANLVKSEALLVDSLLEEVKGRGATVSFFVLDACRNNPFATSGKRSIGLSRGLQLVAPPSGSFVLMSAGSGQAALDRLSDGDPDPNSVFTRKLLPLLETPGLSHVAIAKQVQTQVEDTAKTIGHDQKPSYYDEISGEFVIDPAGQQATGQQATSQQATSQQASAQQQPVSPPQQPAQQPAQQQAAIAPDNGAALTEWNAVKDMSSIAILSSFAKKYAGTPYADYAMARIDELKAQQPATTQPKTRPTPPPQQQASLDPPPSSGDLAVANVPGGWYVVLGSYPYNQQSKARQRANSAISNGYAVKIIDTSNYGSLTPGYYSVVLGPYSRGGARSKANAVKSFVSDAYPRQIQ